MKLIVKPRVEGKPPGYNLVHETGEVVSGVRRVQVDSPYNAPTEVTVTFIVKPGALVQIE